MSIKRTASIIADFALDGQSPYRSAIAVAAFAGLTLAFLFAAAQFFERPPVQSAAMEGHPVEAPIAGADTQTIDAPERAQVGEPILTYTADGLVETEVRHFSDGTTESSTFVYDDQGRLKRKITTDAEGTESYTVYVGGGSKRAPAPATAAEEPTPEVSQSTGSTSDAAAQDAPTEVGESNPKGPDSNDDS